MKRKEWNEGMNHIDADLVDKYVEQKDKLRQNINHKNLWLCLGAIAACFCLILGVLFSVPLLQDNGNVPTWNTAKYSAQNIADLFNMKNLNDSVATNAYTTICVPDAQYLHIGKVPDQKHFGVYQYNLKENKLNKNDFQDFVDSFLPKLADSIDVAIPQYEIKEENSYDEKLAVNIDVDSYYIFIQQNEINSSFRLFKRSDDDRQIILDGETVQIDQRLSDEEIINSIQSIKNKLSDIFNISFSDTKVVRKFGPYSEYGAEHISIYFYNETAHPLNSIQDRPISDYICISFDNFANYWGDIVSDSILTVADINYTKGRNDITEEYTLIANAKKISLEDAETLLYNGYVFGGHSCPLCMTAQDKVSFDGYDFVDIEYVFGRDYTTNKQTEGIPFYAFYKKIGTSENEIIIYAKTYVPAIEVSGLDQYFQSQMSNHKNSSDEVAE